MNIVSREEAKKDGLKYYFTGLSCSKGHISKRFVDSYGCHECSVLNQKKKRISKGCIPRYKTEEERKQGRKEALRKYAEKNADKLRESQEKYKLAHPERRKAAVAKWDLENHESKRIRAHTRRARKREVGGTLSPGIAEKLLKLQNGKCACCGKKLGTNYQLDHIIPIALGGPNIDSNIQLLRPLCNRQKSAKHPVEFMQQRGFLL